MMPESPLVESAGVLSVARRSRTCGLLLCAGALVLSIATPISAHHSVQRIPPVLAEGVEDLPQHMIVVDEHPFLLHLLAAPRGDGDVLDLRFVIENKETGRYLDGAVDVGWASGAPEAVHVEPLEDHTFRLRCLPEAWVGRLMEIRADTAQGPVVFALRFPDPVRPIPAWPVWVVPLILAALTIRSMPAAASGGWRVRLLRASVRSRPLWVFLFLFVLGVGCVGSLYRNFAPGAAGIWWLLLVSLSVLLGGKIWCAMCPWDALADLVVGRRRTLGWAWPKRWSTLLVPTLLLGFLVVAEYVWDLTDDPRSVAWLGAGLTAVAVLLGCLFRGKPFCRYVCPVGAACGAYGSYASIGALRVEPRDTEICARCTERTCFGSPEVPACPVCIWPGGIRDVQECILCGDCLYTCAHANMDVQAGRSRRPRAGDSFLLLLLLSLPLYHAVHLVPGLDLMVPLLNGGLLAEVLLMAACCLGGIVLTAVPLRIGAMATGGGGAADAFRWGRNLQTLLPLGLFAHMAYLAGLVVHEGQRTLPAWSDPLGFGWDLLGWGGGGPTFPISAEGLLGVQAVLIVLGGVLALALVFAQRREDFPAGAWRRRDRGIRDLGFGIWDFRMVPAILLLGANLAALWAGVVA